MNKKLKKMLSVLICLLLCIQVISIIAYAEDSHIGEIVYVEGGTRYTAPSGKYEGVMNVSDGHISYCIDWNTPFAAGNAVVHNALERFSQDDLNLIYAAYVLRGDDMWSYQCMLWKYYNNNNVCGVYGISEASVDDLYNRANAAKDSYVGHGYVYEMTNKAQTTLTVWGEMKGYLRLHKSSSNASVTNNNNCYTLAGAQYGVYSDANCASLVANLTTDANGNSNTVALIAGVYYIKEISAPRNYVLDKKVYSVNVTGSNTLSNPAILYTSDAPGNTTEIIEINKIDKFTRDLYNGDANSLEDAEFTIKYYDNTVGSASGNVKKTWVIKSKLDTNTNKCIAKLDENHKIGGDEFYKNGDGKLILPVGTYIIEETKAPKNYILDNTKISTKGANDTEGTKITAIVADSKTSWKLNFGNELEYKEQILRGKAYGVKYDNDLYKNTPQGASSLKGIKLAIINESENFVAVSEGGRHYEKNEEISEIEIITDENGKWSTNEKALPYGTYKVVEKESNGYYRLNKDWFVEFEIRKDGQSIDCNDKKQILNSSDNEMLVDRVVRGGLQVIKQDKEISKSETIGGKNHGGEGDEEGSHLEGIEFTITNANERDIVVRDTNDFSSQNGRIFDFEKLGNKAKSSGVKIVKSGGEIGKIYTHWNEELKCYSAQTMPNDLPYGYYKIKETATTDSYLLSDAKEREVFIDNKGESREITDTNIKLIDYKDFLEDKALVTKDKYGNDLIWKDQVVRGDVKLTKIENKTSKRMAVPFVIKNLTTGEMHVIVTNKNGQFSSESKTNSNQTNSNDEGIIKDGKIICGDNASDLIDYQSLNTSAGLWFGLGEDGTISDIDDSLSSLPYGKYEIRELYCENNANHKMQKFEFWINENSTTLDLDTITDEQIIIHTQAMCKETGEQTAKPEKVTIVDKVYYNGLIEGEEYTVKGELIDKKTGEPVIDNNGEKVVGKTSFSAVSDSGEEEVKFELDATNLENADTVLYERMYKDDNIIATHANINNKKQSILFKENPHIVNVKSSPPKPIVSNLPKTGDNLWRKIIKNSLIAAVSLRFILDYLDRRKVKKHRKNNIKHRS